MKAFLEALSRTTAFRLARLNGLVFLALAAALVGYIYFATAGQINASADKDATREFNDIAWLSGETRYDALNQAIIERAAATRDYLYLLCDAEGRRISGNVSMLPDERLKMMQITGRRTVPQIFIGSTHVGGCDDLMALDSRGGLDPLLSSSDASA